MDGGKVKSSDSGVKSRQILVEEKEQSAILLARFLELLQREKEATTILA